MEREGRGSGAEVKLAWDDYQVWREESPRRGRAHTDVGDRVGVRGGPNMVDHGPPRGNRPKGE